MIGPEAYARAVSHIERESEEWFDYCADVGHIPSNVAHLRGIRRDFARWLQGDA